MNLYGVGEISPDAICTDHLRKVVGADPEHRADIVGNVIALCDALDETREERDGLQVRLTGATLVPADLFIAPDDKGRSVVWERTVHGGTRAHAYEHLTSPAIWAVLAAVIPAREA